MRSSDVSGTRTSYFSRKSGSSGWSGPHRTQDWDNAASGNSSSDDEDGLVLRQPFPISQYYENAPVREGRGARPQLNSNSTSSAFQEAFDQQQTFWQRKWHDDPDFQEDINACAEIQTWMLKAIDENKLDVEMIRIISQSCATAFLKALGYIKIGDGTDGRSIQWTEELLSAFEDGGTWYSGSSRKTFLFGQFGSIFGNGANVCLEIARPAMHGPTIDKMKLGIRAALLTLQCYVTSVSPLLAAHEQPKGVKGQELAGFPYTPNVSSIEYKICVATPKGDHKVEAVPYPDANNIRWSLNLIHETNTSCKDGQGALLKDRLESRKVKLKAKLAKFGPTESLSRTQKNNRQHTEACLKLVRLAIQRASKPADTTIQAAFTVAEGALKKELALAEIAEKFNSAPAQSKVRSTRYKIFATQALLTIAGAGARLGHCVPNHVAETARNATQAIVDQAIPPITTVLTPRNATLVSDLVAECTGFNPWGFSLELANFGLSILNPAIYWLNLPEAAGSDTLGKFVAYTTALMLQPHGKLTDDTGAVDPKAFEQMLRGRMWRVIDCTIKALESDLHGSGSALMTFVVDIAPNPRNERHPYKTLLVQFEALKTPEKRKHYMETVFSNAGREYPESVEFLLQHYDQIVEAVDLLKKGKISKVLDGGYLPLGSQQLLKSGLTIAAGGNFTKADENSWAALMKVFGDIEATSKKTEQEAQKFGQALAKKGLAGTAGFTLLKSFIDLCAAIAKSQSEFEHDKADVVAKIIQIIGGATALGSAYVGYLVSYCYWQFILEKNRQRQATLNDKFFPPNSSILNPDANSYLRACNPDRRKGVVTNFKTLLAHSIDESLINRNSTLTYDKNQSSLWGDAWAQINVIDLGLNARNLCQRLKEIVNPGETVLDTQLAEVLQILRGEEDKILEQLREHGSAQKTGAPPSTTLVLKELFVEEADSTRSH